MQKTETKSAKTEHPVKMNFIEALNLLRSENSKVMKVPYISVDHEQKGRFSDIPVTSSEFKGGLQKNCFCAEIQI